MSRRKAAGKLSGRPPNQLFPDIDTDLLIGHALRLQGWWDQEWLKAVKVRAIYVIYTS